MIKLMQPMLAKIHVESVEIKIEAMKMSAVVAPRPYALLPSDIVLSIPEKKARLRKETNFVAVMDGGTWYLDRVDSPAKFGTLSQLYPSLAPLTKEIKQGSVQQIK